MRTGPPKEGDAQRELEGHLAPVSPVLRHSAIYLTGRVLPGLAGVASIAVFSRMLTPAQYGQWALVTAAGGMTNAVCFHWISQSLGRLLPGNQEPLGILVLAKWFYWRIILATLVLGVVAGIFAPHRLLEIALVLGMTWAQAWFDMRQAATSARLASRRYGLQASIKSVVALGAGYLAVRAEMGYPGVVLATCLGLIVGGHIGPTVAAPNKFGQITRQELAPFLRYGMPFAATYVLALILDVSDRFLIGLFMGSADVAKYSAAYDLAQQTIGAMLSAVNLAAFPLAVSALEERGWAAAEKQLSSNLSMLLAIALPSTLGMALLAPEIAHLVLGPDIASGSASIIPIVAASALVWGIKSFYLDSAFQLSKRPGMMTVPLLLSASSNVAINVVAIPAWGLRGAAWATLSAVTVGALSAWAIGRRLRKLPGLQKVHIQIIAASATMGAGLWLATSTLKVGMPILMALGTAIYAAALLAINPANCRSVLFARLGRHRS